MSQALVSIESSMRLAAHPLPRTKRRGRCVAMMRRLTRIQRGIRSRADGRLMNSDRDFANDVGARSTSLALIC